MFSGPQKVKVEQISRTAWSFIIKKTFLHIYYATEELQRKKIDKMYVKYNIVSSSLILKEAYFVRSFLSLFKSIFHLKQMINIVKSRKNIL